MPKEESEPAAFSGLRGEGGFRLPVLRDAAWHLSSFGDAAAIRGKFKSWGHANTFLAAHEQLHEARARAAAESRERGAAERPARAPKGRASLRGFLPNGYENQV